VQCSLNGTDSAVDMVTIFESCFKLCKVDFEKNIAVTDEVVQTIASHCPLLEHFTVSNGSAVSDAAMKAVAYSCPLLPVIHTNHLNITDATVALLRVRCPHLIEIQIGFSPRLTDVAVAAIAKGLPGLTHIDLGVNIAITTSAIENLASKCCELEFIGLNQCPNVSDVTLMKICGMLSIAAGVAR
jgi:hypothetical protein